MKRGLIRYSPGYPKEAQRLALLADGVAEKDIYEWEDREELIRSTRRRDQLCVNGLDRLGEDWDDLILTLDRCEAKGFVVRNVESGRDADPGAAADLALARRRFTGEARRPSDAAIKRGARKRKGRKKERAVSREELHAIWFDKSILTNDLAAEKATALSKERGGKKITRHALTKLFGGSKRPAGWRVGQKRND